MKTFLYELSIIVTYGGIIQSVFVVLLLNNKSVKKSRANIFLSVLLLTLSFSTAHILFAGAVINHLDARIYSLGDPTFYLIAPLLWFYTRELTGQRINISRRLILHFLPFFAIIVSSISFRLFDSESFRRFLLDHQHEVNIAFWVTLVIQFSWYQLLVQRRWNYYHDIIRQEVSNTENISISWVRFYMIIFLLINILFLVSLVVAIHFETGSWLTMTTAFVFSLSVFALGYKGILQKEIFRQDRSEVAGHKAALALGDKSKIEPELIERLSLFMRDRKPYLDPELTLTSLAQELGLSRGQLSQLINDGIGSNFYDFVNRYRVEEVKLLMHRPDMKNFNMLGIALEAGFKSKSTFNLIFKRFTGLTPTEFKKNNTN